MKKIVILAIICLLISARYIVCAQEADYVEIETLLTELALDTTTIFNQPLLTIDEQEAGGLLVFNLSEDLLGRTESTHKEVKKFYKRFLRFKKRYPDGLDAAAACICGYAIVGSLGNAFDLIVIERGLREISVFPAEGNIPIFVNLIQLNLTLIKKIQLETSGMCQLIIDDGQRVIDSN